MDADLDGLRVAVPGSRASCGGGCRGQPGQCWSQRRDVRAVTDDDQHGGGRGYHVDHLGEPVLAGRHGHAYGLGQGQHLLQPVALDEDGVLNRSEAASAQS